MIFKVSWLRIEINREQDTFCVESRHILFLIVYLRVADTFFIYYFYGFTRDATLSSVKEWEIYVSEEWKYLAALLTDKADIRNFFLFYANKHDSRINRNFFKTFKTFEIFFSKTSESLNNILLKYSVFILWLIYLKIFVERGSNFHY